MGHVTKDERILRAQFRALVSRLFGPEAARRVPAEEKAGRRRDARLVAVTAQKRYFLAGSGVAAGAGAAAGVFAGATAAAWAAAGAAAIFSSLFSTLATTFALMKSLFPFCTITTMQSAPG